MDPILLGPLGPVPVRRPPSLATVTDIVLSTPTGAVTSPRERAQRNRLTARLAAASVGVCLDWQAIRKTASSAAEAVPDEADAQGTEAHTAALQELARTQKLAALGRADGIHYDPIYDDIYAYGAVMLAVLMQAGVPLSTILREGSNLGERLAKALPTDSKVSDTVDFT